MLFVGGYEFLTPPPEITADGVRQSPSDGARKLNARIDFFYPATGITPAMCMRLTGIGSQYLMASRDADGEYLDGARNYRLNLPADVPESRFWSVMRRTTARRARCCRPTSRSQPRQPVRHRRAERRRLDRHLLRPRGAGREGAQLDPDHPRQGLVRDPAPLQPAPAVLRQELAAERDRALPTDRAEVTSRVGQPSMSETAAQPSAVLPFHDPSRGRRLVKVGGWLVGIALVLVVLNLLGVDVVGWLSRPLGPDQGRPARLHGRGARIPDGPDALRRAVVLRHPARRLSGPGRVLADRDRVRGGRVDEQLPAGEHRHVRDAGHVRRDHPGLRPSPGRSPPTSSRRSSSRSPARSSTSTCSCPCPARSTRASATSPRTP